MIWGFFAAIGIRQFIVDELIISGPYQQNVQIKPNRNLSKFGSWSTTEILHTQIYDRIAESEDVFFIGMVVKSLDFNLLHCYIRVWSKQCKTAQK